MVRRWRGGRRAERSGAGPTRWSTGRRVPVSDADMVTLVTAHGVMRSLGGQTGSGPAAWAGWPRLPGGDRAAWSTWPGRRRSQLVSLVDARRRVLLLRHGFAQDRLVDRQDAAW